MKRKFSTAFIFTMCFLLFNFTSFSQYECVAGGYVYTGGGIAPPCPENTIGGCIQPGDPCPIDNGVYLLVGFAVLIAIKKAYDYKKQLIVA